MLQFVADVLPDELAFLAWVGWPLLYPEESLNELCDELLGKELVELARVVRILQNDRHERELEHRILLLVAAL